MTDSNSRRRLTVDSSQLFGEDVLHSTPIPPASVIAPAPNSKRPRIDSLGPIVITAPSGFPNFSMVLQKHGFILSKPRNSLLIDQLTFRKTLADWLTEQKVNHGGDEFNKFVSAMKSYLCIRDNLIHSMSPTMNRDEVFQTSLLHNLLAVADLQPEVLTVLFPTLIEASYIASCREDVDLSVSIMNQLKWMPNLVEEELFVSSILDLVENGTKFAQKEMIRFLPDIIPESHHPRVGEMLRKLLDNGTEAVSSIMDCFSSLDISDYDWGRIRDTALSQLFNAPLQDFPAYLGFLFRAENTENLTEIITRMREKLEITPMGKDSKNNEYMVKIVDKIEFCCSINHQLALLWTKLVRDDLTSGGTVKPLDLMILLIFAESFKAPLGPLKMILSNNNLTVKLLDYMLEKNMPVLTKVFTTFSKLCDSILRTKETKAHAVVELIIVKLFLAHGRLEGQEITLNLINLLLTANFGSRDSALRIFTKITQRNPKKLLMFAPHLMGVVDCIAKFSPHHIRQLMNILAVLAHVEGSSDSERFSSEFSILLRKQLTHTHVQTRCLGVLGALATIRQLSLQSKPNERVINELLELSWSFVEREEEPCCIFLDELCDVIQFLPLRFCVQYKRILTDHFQKYWTLEDNGTMELVGQGGLKLVAYFDANKEMEKEKLAIIFEEKHHGMSPRAIPAHLRVIRLLVDKVDERDLTEIDAILGCPILIPDLNRYYCSDASVSATFGQKYNLGLYLVLAINFFRESVSAFVDQDDAELRIKVWLRLSNVVTLQKILAREFHSFHTLPPAYMAEKSIVQLPSTASDRHKKSKRVKRRQVSSKATTQEDEDIDLDIVAGIQDSEKVVLKDFGDSIQPGLIMPYLRRFDPQVFVLLGSPLRVGGELDFGPILLNISTTAAVNLKSVEQLTPDTLILLLLEIRERTSHSQSRLNILDIKNILSHVCNLTDSVLDELQKNVTATLREKLEACLRLLLKTISIYFEAIAQQDEEERQTLFQKGIKILGKRSFEPEEVALSFTEMFERANDRVSELSDYVKDPSTAMEHLHLLKCMYSLSEADEHLAKSIELTSDLYLKTKWKLSGSQVETILKTWLSTAVHPESVMSAIIDSLIPKDVTQKVPCCALFQSCTSVNFPIWYTVLISFLAQHCSKHGRKISNSDEAFQFWKSELEILKDLVSVTKRDRRRVIFVPLLRHTRLFLDIFITSGIKLLPYLWNENADEAKIFTKTLQSTTRKIQSICEHSKVEGDVQLLKYVPLVKRALETLVFRVRQVLVNDGVPNAFWMGSLKHRNLDGELINSQMFEDIEVSDGSGELSDDDNNDLQHVTTEDHYSEDEIDDLDGSDSDA